MGEHNSPYFDAGTADGIRDREIVEGCPMGLPVGMDSDRIWSFMYQRGYNREMDAAVPHGTCPQCAPELYGKQP